jgi:polyferredoxin
MARRFSSVVRARVALQLGFLVMVVLLGLRFSLWVFAQLAGRAPRFGRPPGVEGFLPISALMSFRLWLAGGGVHSVHPAALAIFLAIVAMSALVAKSFCSHLCPVGAISEWLGRLGARLLGRTWLPPRWLDVPLRALRYVLLAFFVWATWVAMNTVALRAFLDSPYNKVADVKMLLFFAHPSELTVAVLGVLVVGSLLVRDLWCRYLCPYGALLGLVGRLAPLKVTRDLSTCIDCERCTKACPARLTVHTLRRVASVECTSCQDCVAACPVAGCLSILPPGALMRGWRFRPAAMVWLATAVYVAVLLVFVVAGKWHGSVSEEEYATRLRDIDSPVYTHVGGLAASEPARSAPAHPEPDGRP